MSPWRSSAWGYPARPRSGGHRRPPATGPGARRGFGTTWWGAAWIEALEGRARLDPNRLPRGRSYARSGAVAELSVAPGEVRAAVQGSRATPYQVRVRVREFSDTEWDTLLAAVAAQVGHAAALLDGELAPEVLTDVREAGLDLLPGPGELQPRCSCPDWADPCKHAAAVCYLVADALDADPFTLLLLRGRDREAVLAGLRARRGGDLKLPASATSADRGQPARQAYAAAAAGLSELPAPPLPPESPGRLVGWGVTDTRPVGVDPDALIGLAGDAVRRAHALALGTGDDCLGLWWEADLARRAEAYLDAPEFAVLAARARLPTDELRRWALAWRYAGVAGLDVLGEAWSPPPEDLLEGRAALGGQVRAWRNRLTRGSRQLRLGRDHRWHPYRRVGPAWEPAGPAAADPRAAAAVFGAGPAGRSPASRRPG